ncbi:MAG: deoxynucleoside kinase [Endomicrobiaceae bacterium]
MIRRIEICGGIASGKTTLVQQFEKNGYFSIYEDFKNNPFLHNFYSDTTRYAFETELTFSLQHFHALKISKTQKQIITDYSLEQDYAYAKNNLTSSELLAFETVFNEIIQQVGQASIVVYIKCPIELLLNRIEKRNRRLEKAITYDYLDGMINALEKRLNNGYINYVTIDSDKMDFRRDDVFSVVKKTILDKMPSI